jgi:antitoxin (DNA-binding transcriptional repressor) of toxin-antitoxin stability system
MLTKTVDMCEAQKNLTELLSEVAAGTEVILTQDCIPRVRMVPIVSPTTQRVAGLHPGAIWTSDDFDDPLALSPVDGRHEAVPDGSEVTLERLLAGVTDQNLHAEVDTGPRTGNEVW